MENKQGTSTEIYYTLLQLCAVHPSLVLSVGAIDGPQSLKLAILQKCPLMACSANANANAHTHALHQLGHAFAYTRRRPTNGRQKETSACWLGWVAGWDLCLAPSALYALTQDNTNYGDGQNDSRESRSLHQSSPATLYKSYCVCGIIWFAYILSTLGF